MWNQEQHWDSFQRIAAEHGLHCMGVSDTALQACEPHLQAWLNEGMQGEMAYMAKHGMARTWADTLLPGTVSIVSVRMNYVPQSAFREAPAHQFLQNTLQQIDARQAPYISLYARGRDYHKVIRQRLQKFVQAVHAQVGEFGYRVACDSAPTPEVEIARKAGLGWRGKHTLLIHPQEGSLFFLGEIFTNLPLPPSPAFEKNHCGTCTACIDVCPTQAIVKPYQVDARRCVSYLTIEHDSAIPLELRPMVGTRIYGCDDCQLACPWNKFAQAATHADFNVRNGFDQPDWQTLMGWTEQQFLDHTQGMAMRRIGYRRFRRNLAVAAGNAKTTPALIHALKTMRAQSDEFLAEHIDWALSRLEPQTGNAAA